MSCACPRSPKGLSPAAHLADGTTDLILVRKCSRFNFLRHLLRHINKDDQVHVNNEYSIFFPLLFLSESSTPSCPSPLVLLQFDLAFVEVHRVVRFRFTPRYCQSDSDLELDLLENGKRQIFGHICRDHPACGCTRTNSSWNCDGEILTHTAIDVRYSCSPNRTS